MAGIYDMMMSNLKLAETGRAEAKQSQLAKLASQAYTAPRDQRTAVLGQIAGVGGADAASHVQESLGSLDAGVHKQLSDTAAAVLAAPPEQRNAVYQQYAVPLAKQLGLPVPEQWNDGMSQHFQSLAGVKHETHVVGGDTLVDDNGGVLYKSEHARKIVGTKMDDSGTPYVFYDDGSYEPAHMGGSHATMPAPTTGGGADVMSGALADVVRSTVSPVGGRITSTTGGLHNVGSKHYSGNAVDVGMGRESPEQQAQIIAALQARPDLRVVDERQHPPGQAVWGGPHVHVERAQGGPQASPQANGPTFGGIHKPLSAAEQQRMEFDRQRLELAQRAASRADTASTRADKALQIQQQAQRSKPMSGDVANKVGLYDNALTAAQKWAKVVVGKNGEFNDLAAMTPGARALLNEAVRAKLRAESGAAISEAELDGEVSRYMGGLLSSDATNVEKAQTLINDLQHQRDVLVQGRASSPAAPAAPHASSGWSVKRVK